MWNLTLPFNLRGGTMKYTTIRKYDVTNGPGVRVTIFVSGCTHNCEGCFNEDLQDFNHGEVWTDKTEKDFLEYVANPVVVGVNILGGEPLQQIMDDSLLSLLTKIKEQFPEKSIWMWTGDLFEEAMKNEKKAELIRCVDTLIDGPFQLKRRNLKLKYRGSENQRIINVQESLNKDKVIKMTFDV